jgi:uncharacterized repeat protein (TIGR01451 family)
MIILLSNIVTAEPSSGQFFEIKNVAKVDYVTMGVSYTVLSNEIVDQIEGEFGINLVIDGTGSTKTPELYVGGVIDYKLVVNVEGDGVIEDIVITNDIPAGTVYEPNTLKVNGVYMEGYFNVNTITVPLGDMTPQDEHIIEFSAKVI